MKNKKLISKVLNCVELREDYLQLDVSFRPQFLFILGETDKYLVKFSMVIVTVRKTFSIKETFCSDGKSITILVWSEIILLKQFCFNRFPTPTKAIMCLECWDIQGVKMNENTLFRISMKTEFRKTEK